MSNSGSDAALQKKPYAGLRPYTFADKDIFYGRDRAAQLLRNKIYSSCLTLFYAPSGVGKTSLLQALVIPDLEALGSHVVYVDAWEGESAARDLKRAIVASLEDKGLKLSEESGDPLDRRLVDIVSEIAESSDESVVLILDQFEQYLVRRVDDELSRELGQIVRSELNCYVVLSLREEFVAGLEALRENLLNLFDSTFRLQHLTPEEAATAIREPARQFGVTFEDALVDELLEDLRAQHGPHVEVATAIQTGDIELPFLQIVCECLWSEAGKRDATAITLSLYKELGERDGILQKFRDDFSKALSRSEKLKAAKILSVLAPAGGIKNTFTRKGIAQITGLDSEDVGRFLDRLEANRIVRSRESLQSLDMPRADAATRRRYELYHDAFIKVWRPWIEEQLEQEESRLRRMRLAKRAGMAASVVAAIVAFNVWDDYKTHQYIVDDCFEDPDKSVESCFHDLASHFLWSHTDSSRFNDLRDELIRRQDLLPYNYGVDTSGQPILPRVPEEQESTWPLTLYYSTSRNLDHERFLQYWHSYSKELTATLGIPIPQRVVLEDSPTLTRRYLSLEGPGFDTLEIAVDTFEGDAYLTFAYTATEPDDILTAFADEFDRHELPTGMVYWTVPRWTLPIWRTKSIRANDGNGFAALMLGAALLDEPERLLTPQVVDHMIDRVAERHPVTVAEARLARGSRLYDDLRAMARAGFLPRNYLVAFLDMVAEHPDLSSEQLYPKFVDELGMRVSVTPPDEFGGPWQDGESGAAERDAGDLHAAYREILPWPDEKDYELRVVAGNARVWDWLTGDWDGLSALVNDEQYEMMRRFGVFGPAPMVDWASWNEPVFDQDGFVVQLLNLPSDHAYSETVITDARDAVGRLMSEIRQRKSAWRVNWYTAEDVESDLYSFDDALRDWLGDRYSISDLKVLLRAVISPEADEVESIRSMAAGEVSPAPTSHSIQYREWLLRSLVFWTRVSTSPSVLVDRLRETQQARLDWDSHLSASAPGNALVTRGVAALGDGKLDVAASLFADAIAADEGAAVDAFLSAYAADINESLADSVADGCGNLFDVQTGDGFRVDLAEWIDAHGHAEPVELRQWRLCQIASRTRDYLLPGRLAATVQTLESDPELSSWRSDQLLFVAMELIKSAGTSWDPGPRNQLESVLLELLPRMNSEQQADLHQMLLDACIYNSQYGPVRSCYDLAERIATAYPSDFIPIYTAWTLSSLEKRDVALRALDWVELGERAEVSRNPELWRRFLASARANAINTLAYVDDAGHLPAARSALEAVVRLEPIAGYEWMQTFATSLLSDLYFLDDDAESQRSLMELAAQRWGDTLDIRTAEFWIAVQGGDAETVARLGDEIVRDFAATAPVPPENSSALFIGALARLLTEQGRFEQLSLRFLHETQHEYREYVAMMLYASMGASNSADANALLSGRWEQYENRQQEWPARLRAGDAHAWREMLVGYFLGAVPADMIFGPLGSDEAFAASDFNGLYLPRRGLLTEATFYEAMLAKGNGDRDTMLERLREVVSIGYTRYYEYRMARFLLGMHEHADDVAASP